MARIRIVDEWLRSPVSSPARHRVIMVVAASWSEQRVLMRAFASAEDQTRPTITMHGEELAIGPAGVDPYGEWGIHVQPPVDGRAQELRAALEAASRRIAGTRGTPPRLQDEHSSFDQRATHIWGPLPAGTRRVSKSLGLDPADVALMSRSPVIPSAARSRQPNFWSETYCEPEPSSRTRNNEEIRRKRPSCRPTQHGYAQMSSSAPASTESLGTTAMKTMPLGLRLDAKERAVLDALGVHGVLTPSQIGELIGVGDGREWMNGFLTKLGAWGLDVIAITEGGAGASYTLVA